MINVDTRTFVVSLALYSAYRLEGPYLTYPGEEAEEEEAEVSVQTKEHGMSRLRFGEGLKILIRREGRKLAVK